jgi:hypothetical protein
MSEYFFADVWHLIYQYLLVKNFSYITMSKNALHPSLKG